MIAGGQSPPYIGIMLEKLQHEIAKVDRPENHINYQQFFKEKLEHPTGLKTAVLRKISKECFKDIKDQPKKSVLKICDELLASEVRYMRMFAFDWADKIHDQFKPTDFAQIERWLKKYVDQWGSCDHLCCGPLGHLIRQYPELVTRREKWTQSRNRWVRRASAVCLIVPVKNKLLLDEVFATADALLTDTDDMVQKGYGWMLKVASNVYPREVFEYVMRNKAEMPRTALRYAIEKLPPAKRKLAMKK